MAASARSAALACSTRCTRSPSGGAGTGRAERARPPGAPGAAAPLARASGLLQEITLCIRRSGDRRRQTGPEDQFVPYVRLLTSGTQALRSTGTTPDPALAFRAVRVEQATYRHAGVRRAPAADPGPAQMPAVTSGSYKPERTAFRRPGSVAAPPPPTYPPAGRLVCPWTAYGQAGSLSSKRQPSAELRTLTLPWWASMMPRT